MLDEELRKTLLQVAQFCAPCTCSELFQFLASDAALDEHLADQ